MIVVTGATGHVGNVLLRILVVEGAAGLGAAEGVAGHSPIWLAATEPGAAEPSAAGPGSTDLRAVVMPGEDIAPIADLDVQVVEADVRDSEALLKAFEHADIVFHLAGIVSIGSGDFERLREVNVDGTRKVIAACRAAGVRRLVYTSSVHAFAELPDGICLDEGGAVDPDLVHGPYATTKAQATLLVFEAVRQGLDAVVVFPSGIIGPYDHRPSETGQLILDCFQGRIKAYVEGGYNFVDVRDVAQGLISAAARGRRGEGYILSGHEVPVKDLLDTVETLTGARAPRWRLHFGFTRAVSFLIPVYYWLRRERPLFTTYSLDVIASNCLMSYEKAQRELGFSPRPFEQTMADTLAWFRRAGML